MFLDTTYMRWIRDVFKRFFEEDSVCYILVDSSPQGGQNWLMSEKACDEFDRQMQLQHADPSVYTEEMHAAFLRLDDIRAAQWHHVFHPVDWV